MPADPLISCLMVTLPVPERFDRLKESVAGYVGQTYRPRELVVVANGGVPEALAAIKAHIASLGRDDIRILEPPGTLTLGALRNISKASARGEVVCQWDDDDLFHPERLRLQLAALVESGAEAVCLQHVMQYFRDDRRLYCTNFRNSVETVFPGSLMCWARTEVTYPETGERALTPFQTTLPPSLSACRESRRSRLPLAKRVRRFTNAPRCLPPQSQGG